MRVVAACPTVGLVTAMRRCFVSIRFNASRIVFLKKTPITSSLEKTVEEESYKGYIVVLMRILDVISSDEAVDSAFDEDWWVCRRGSKVEIEVHLFLKNLGRNLIAINS